MIFQSTHPGWGATLPASRRLRQPQNFNPRTPGGVRPSSSNASMSSKKFQSTHPGWGATIILITTKRWLLLFQSTHPGWGATSETGGVAGSWSISIHAPRVGCDPIAIPGYVQIDNISIHAPRVGCDLCAHSINNVPYYFNPRTPGGVRRQKCIKDEMAFMFFCAYFSICM